MSLEQCLTSKGKTHAKKLEGSKFGPKFVSLVFLDIAQDCGLGQYLTSSRELELFLFKKSKKEKKSCSPN